MADPKIDKFKKVLQMDPNDETLWFGLGKAYMGDENWEEAVSALESCLKVKPTYSAAILALAQSLKHANQPERCRTVCAQGIDVATANGDLLVIKNLEELREIRCLPEPPLLTGERSLPPREQGGEGGSDARA